MSEPIEKLDALPVRAALQALDESGVAYCLRNSPDRVDRPEHGGDVDVVIGGRDADRASQVLGQQGWHRLAAPGHRGHRFFVRRWAPGWLKIDLMTGSRYGRRRVPVDGLLRRRRLVDGLWLAGPADEARHRELRAAGFRECPSVAERIARALPVGLRRRGCVVALVGPDGAGKGTVLDGLVSTLPVAVTRVYLGDPRSAKGSRGEAVGSPSVWREAAWLARKAARLWALLGWAYVRAWRGHVVLCDRHPLEMAAVRPRRTRPGAVLEGLLFGPLPWPDALVVLDAPASVLFARKAEHDVAVLDRWRRGYLAMRERGAVVVSTQTTPAAATQACLDVVWAALARRRGWTGQ